MKKFQLFACALATALFTLSFTACDEDDPFQTRNPLLPRHRTLIRIPNLLRTNKPIISICS